MRFPCPLPARAVVVLNPRTITRPAPRLPCLAQAATWAQKQAGAERALAVILSQVGQRLGYSARRCWQMKHSCALCHQDQQW